ncbi:MAG: SLC13 family permease [Dehalococcoidia bacterium]|nr:SLC13 family permease [Dehalococcoidia bacterium]
MVKELKKGEIPGTPKQFAIFMAIVMAVAFLCYWGLRDIHQTLAATVCIALVVGTLMFWRFRVAIAFIGMAILLLTGTMDLKHAIEFMSLDVIVFLVGMMVVVALLRDTGFFRWLGIKIIKLGKYEPRSIMISLLLLSAVMAACVDEVTSILFMTALVFELCERYKIDPVKCVISVVLATNIGSSWTVLGNPIGILLALRAGLTFEDFMRWSFPVSLIGLICLIVIILVWQRGDLKLLKTRINAQLESGTANLDEWSEIKDKTFFKWGIALFLGVVVFLALHYRLELLFGLERDTLLVATSITGAGIAMLWKRDKAREYLERGVDWWTLIFFLFLFSVAGCLAYTSVTGKLADAATGLTTSPVLLTITIALGAAFGSAALDNVILVAALIPVVQAFGAIGVNSFPLWWALLQGACYGGNITMVGSTANIVALGMLEQRTGYRMTFRKWILIGLAGGLLPLFIAQALLLVQLPLMP